MQCRCYGILEEADYGIKTVILGTDSKFTYR